MEECRSRPDFSATGPINALQSHIGEDGLRALLSRRRTQFPKGYDAWTTHDLIDVRGRLEGLDSIDYESCRERRHRGMVARIRIDDEPIPIDVAHTYPERRVPIGMLSNKTSAETDEGESVRYRGGGVKRAVEKDLD
jgi:hypothetical protein